VGEPGFDACQQRPDVAAADPRRRGGLELAFVSGYLCTLGRGADTVGTRGRVTDAVDLVFANVLVGARTLVVEELGIALRNVQHDLVVGARNQDLSRLCKSHDTLSDIDAITDDIGLAVEIANQSNRA